MRSPDRLWTSHGRRSPPTAKEMHDRLGSELFSLGDPIRFRKRVTVTNNNPINI
ncbi:MAG: hypothetical protein AB4352_29980 [Hormoscilla sp.]